MTVPGINFAEVDGSAAAEDAQYDACREPGGGSASGRSARGTLAGPLEPPPGAEKKELAFLAEERNHEPPGFDGGSIRWASDAALG